MAMKHEPDPARNSRENLLTVALVLLVGGLMLFFLYLISLGIVGNLIAAGVVFVVVLCLHYLVWGKSFSDEIAAEREAIRRKENQEILAPPPPWQEASEAIQDISVTKAVKRKDAQ
jgi:small-conductance mechanosensitive channel